MQSPPPYSNKHETDDDVIKWNLFRVTDPMCREFPSPVMRILMLLWYGPAQAVEQTVEWSVIWDDRLYDVHMTSS